MVILVGSVGYYLILEGNPDFIDCVYMTVISITTVGYGEIVKVTGNRNAQIFTMFLITFGMGIILYGIGAFTALVIEGELTGMLRKKRMIKQINKMNRHHIVCGGGETGRQALAELIKNREEVVLIEKDEKNICQCLAIENFPYIQGDATEDENLVAAGIDRAAGVIISLPSDNDNLYVTMTARMLNKKIRIITRMINEKLEPKLKIAGADRVVAPNSIGALRMASEMIRPTAVDFLDNMLRSKSNLRISQLTVSKDSILAGKKLSESGIKNKFDLLVLGAKDDHQDIEFNPSAAKIMSVGLTLIVMGEVDNILKAKEAF